MAETVYIFGAGASRSMGTPLLAEFVTKIHELRKQGGDISQADFDLVGNVLRSRLTKLHSKSKQNIQNIEMVFNLVEMGRLIGRFPDTEPQDIEGLSRAIQSVLAETIEHTCLFNYDFREQQWQPPQYYDRVVKAWLSENGKVRPGEAAFLTFNYDLGLDFAIHWNNATIDYGLGAPIAGAMPLLKLHGSLNWSSIPGSSQIHVLTLDRIFQNQPRPRSSSPNKASEHRRLHVKNLLRLAAPTEPVPPGPAIVPPSWNKTQYHSQFESVWKRAAKELSEAEEIFVIGYSYPESDPFFHSLMALGTEGESLVRKFVVVDPSAKVGQRFEALVGEDVKGSFEHLPITFEEWVQRAGSLRKGILKR